MTTTTVFATIDFNALTNVTGGCHKQAPPQVINNNNNNVVQAPPAAPAPVAPQIIQAPPERHPVSVAIDTSGY